MTATELGPIVVGIGGGQVTCAAALRFAAEAANRTRAPLVLVHGCQPRWRRGGLEPALPLTQRQHRGQRWLSSASRQLKQILDHGIVVDHRISSHTGESALLTEAAKASLVVLQRRDISPLGHWSTGSTTSSLAAKAPCPVAVVRSSYTLGIEKAPDGVVVGVDSSDSAGHALAVAFQQATLRQTVLTAIHLWSSPEIALSSAWLPPMTDEVDDHREELRRQLAQAVTAHSRAHPDVAVRQRIIDAPVVPGLAQSAHEAELLVVGRHGKPGIGSIGLGRVARACLNGAPCPVIVTASGPVIVAASG